MSKTSQENKAAKTAKKTKLAVEVPSETEGRNASDKSAKVSTKTEEVNAEVNTEVKEEVDSTDEVIKTKAVRVRGKKYQAARKLVDPNQLYSLSEAVKLVKKTSFSKFDGKIEAHITVFDIGNAGDIVFPHLELGTKNIVILNDAILAEIKDGKVNFDILVATPITMPKLLPFARLLGPKGLMPNPKNGTLTDKPEEAVKKLSVAKTSLKTEKKAPVVHIVIAKISQPDSEIVANINELIKIIKAPKIKKLALCATMGPSVKIAVEK